MKYPVSLVVITKNEAPNIERCIKSVPWADDIVILDSKSNDNTADIAKSLGARVFIEDFRGFREQKSRATELAKHDWVLSLDADEALGPEASQEIQKLLQLKNFEQHDGFELPRLSFHLGRWIRHGGWYPDFQLRFFNKKKCQWVGGHVHESVRGKSVLRLKNPILHWVFKDLYDQIETNNDYSSRGAKDLLEKGQKFSLFKLIFKPPFKFLEAYIWKLGFLDGLPGFIIATGAAYSLFLKYAKLKY